MLSFKKNLPQRAVQQFAERTSKVSPLEILEPAKSFQKVS